MSAPQPNSGSRSDKARSTPLGMYDPPSRQRISWIEVIAIALSLLWLVGAAIFFVALPAEGSGL
ncbi:MAG: hypothetical protein AB7S99_21895, partial [Pseudodonghicola sp.]